MQPVVSTTVLLDDGGTAPKVGHHHHQHRDRSAAGSESLSDRELRAVRNRLHRTLASRHAPRGAVSGVTLSGKAQAGASDVSSSSGAAAAPAATGVEADTVTLARAGDSIQLWRLADRRLVASVSISAQTRFSCPALFVYRPKSGPSASGGAGLVSPRARAAARRTPNGAAAHQQAQPNRGRGANSADESGVWIAALDRASLLASEKDGEPAAGRVGGSALVILDPSLAGLPQNRDLEDSARALPASVARLIDAGNGHVLALLADGSVFETDVWLKRPQRLVQGGSGLIESSEPSAEWRLVWNCSLAAPRDSEGVLLLLLAFQREGSHAQSHIEVISMLFEESGAALGIRNIEQLSVPYCGRSGRSQSEVHRAVDCSFDEVEAQLAVLWDDGAWDIWQLSFDLLCAGATGSDPSLLLSQRGCGSVATVENGFVSFIGADTVAVVLSTISLAQPDTFETEVQMWDTSFGTLRGRRHVARPSEASRVQKDQALVEVDSSSAGVLTGAAVKKMRSGAQNPMVEASLAIAFERAVVLVSIVGAPVSLANVLGTGPETTYRQDFEHGDGGAASVSATLDLERYLRTAFKDGDLLVAQTQPELAPEASVAAAAASLSKSIRAANEQEGSTLAKLSDATATSTTATFWAEFFKFVRSRLVTSTARSGSRSAGEAGVARSVEDNIPLLAAHEEDDWDLRADVDDDDVRIGKVKRLDVSQTFVAAVLARCLRVGPGFTDTDSIFSKPIRYLVRHQVVGLHAHPATFGGMSVDPVQKLLPAAMEAQDLNLLASVLQHVLDLSAVDLVKLVSFFLSGYGTSISRRAVKPGILAEFARSRLGFDDRKADSSELQFGHQEQTAQSTAIDFFLDCIVVVPLNDIAAQHALKYLTLEVVMHLLRYLLAWFELHARFSGNFIRKSRRAGARRQHAGKHIFEAPTPELGDIVTWLSLVLDAHFAELVLVEECHELLRSVQQCSRDHVVLCEKLEPLAGFLDVFLNQKPVPEGKQTDYVVETFVL